MPPPACPWDSFEPANLTFCERNLCGWIAQPANTWSNLGFLIAAVAVGYLAWRDGARRAGLLAPIAALTGLTSAAFHATGTFAGQAADQSAMFLESALFVTLNVSRWRRWAAGPLAALYLALVATSIAALLRFPRAGIGIFIAQVVTFVAIELRLVLAGEPDGRPVRRGALTAVALTFAASYLLWWLDRLGILCDPANHVFTAHAAWHLLGALSFYFWYRHYAQFEPIGGRHGESR